MFLTELRNYVTEKYLEGVVSTYEDGGLRWADSRGLEWHLVPVVALVATDVKEARLQKGLFQSYNCRVPCHLCYVDYDHCDDPVGPQSATSGWV